MNPVPIFIPLGSPQPTCPHCGKSEEIREVCAHCNYEYKSTPWSLQSKLIYWVTAVITFLLATQLLASATCIVECNGINALVITLLSMIIGALWPITIPLALLVTLVSFII